MFDSRSYVNPTPLAHADASRDVLPRGGTSQADRSFQIGTLQVGLHQEVLLTQVKYNQEMNQLTTCNFWYRRFHSGIFDVKEAPRTGRTIVENVSKIPEIIEVNRHNSSRGISQELKIDHKTVLNHLSKVGFKTKPPVSELHQFTLKNMMDRISLCEALAKRNEIDPFFKRMVTGNKQWVT
ncbi:histone-lysine N-methyltransferase SETMAR [Trichonephila clavipes]|nr:histone-lysine N-methyltransferase SETMAR [Trichonephila clavipes]